MKVLIGLGNPGKPYERTPHNAGYIALDHLVKIFGKGEKWTEYRDMKAEIVDIVIDRVRCVLIKPVTFMNNSGYAVAKYINYNKVGLRDIILFHDDLDIELGKYKIQMGTSPKCHNGVSSVDLALKSKEYMRVRIGIESREDRNMIAGEDYVVKRMDKENYNLMLETIEQSIPEIIDILSK